MRLRLTLGPWGQTLEEVLQVSRTAESAGAEVLWFPEMHRSATVVAATAAQATSTVGIGTAIALAFVRTPLTTALEALDIDEAASGRFRLGLGTGVQRLNEDWHNARWGKPVAHLRETVHIIRLLVAEMGAGRALTYEGDWERLSLRGYQRPFHQARLEIPVYLGGLGPAMTRLAGELGDGFLSHELCSPQFLEARVLPNIHEGRRASERASEDFDVVVSACCSIDEDVSKARRRSAGLVGFYATVKSYAPFFAFHGLESDQRKVLEAFAAGVPADGLADSVSDRMVDALTLSGTADDVRRKLLAYEGLATSVKLTPPTHGLSPEETRPAQSQIIGLVADLRERATT